MQNLIRLWFLTALVALVTICWPAGALVFASDVATVNDHTCSSKPFSPIQVCVSASSGYDGQSQVEITYGRSAMPVLVYDGPTVHVGNQSGNRAVCERDLFAKFAGFLAAEGELSGTALARQLGQAGEDAVGITGPKTAIEIPGSSQIRIPDALTDTTLTEVKNVGSLSYTQQLQDFTTYSQANGLNFELWVRPSTQLSGPLQQAIANGQIALKFIPGAP
jgi:hypothetical protein